MSDDPRAAVAAALSRPDAEAPLAVLHSAVDWATISLAAEPGQDETVAFEWVRALDRVLAKLVELLGYVPGLIQLASPGGAVSDRIACSRAEVEQQAATLAREHAALDEARGLEEQLREMATERDKLKARIADLDRRRQWAEEVPDLRKQADALEKAVVGTDKDGDEVAQRLTKGAERLRMLTEEQQALLGTEVGRLLKAITTADAAVAEARAQRASLDAELAARQTDAETLQAEYGEQFPVLQAHKEADQDLADGLSAAGFPAGGSGLQRVRTELADIETRLANLDAQLQPLLKAHAEAYQKAREARSWLSARTSQS